MAALVLPYWSLAAAGAVTLMVVALAILHVAGGNAAARAFSAYLIVRGGNGLTATLREGDPDAQLRAAFAVLDWIMTAGTVLTLLVFVSLYPRRWRIAGRALWGGAAALAMLFVGWIVANPSTIAALPWSGGISVSASGIASVVLALAFRREPAGSLRNSLLLIIVAQTTYLLYVASLRFTSLVTDRAVAGLDSPLVYFGTAIVILATALVFAPGNTPLPRAERRLAIGLTTAAIASGIVSVYSEGDFSASVGVAGFFRGFWRFALPLLAAYGILRHQLFDVDLRLKWTIRRGAVASIFIGVFFVVAQLAQNYLTESQGWAIGGVAAGLLLFGIAPLQRMAERVADAAMPNVNEPVRRGAAEDAAAYRAAVEMALADGVVTRQEEKALARLAERLGIGSDAAWSIREDVEREVGSV